MTIRRTALAGDQFAILQRRALQDTSLSYRALGILCAVLSRPQNWRTSAEQLSRERPGGEGRDAVRTALAELEKAGYLVRSRVRDPRTGRISTTWDLSDTPVEPAGQGEQGEIDVVPGHTDDGFPAVGSPAVGSPGILERGETKPRDKTPSPPSPVVSPGEPDQQAGQGGKERESDGVEDLLGAVVAAVGSYVPEEELRASRPLRVALRVLAKSGVTRRALLDACERKTWDGARGAGVVVTWAQERARARDLVVVASGPAVPECVEHPGEPAGRCRLCERRSVPAPDGWRKAV